VRRLVHADGEQKCDDLEDNFDVLQIHSGLASILPCAFTGTDAKRANPAVNH
jgi:hypothetical protein